MKTKFLCLVIAGLMLSCTTGADGDDDNIKPGGEQHSPDDIIKFKDSTVERICLELWDNNKDGGLSYAEAARVRVIRGLAEGYNNSSTLSVENYSPFAENEDIYYFDEFQYFTGLSNVAPGLFLGCKGLKSITIPGSITSIGDFAFYEIMSLKSVTILEGVKSIGHCAFDGCEQLKSIIIPSSVTTISYNAFACCYRLSSITIPEHVTIIDDCTFASCDNLTSITIPKNLTMIGKSAFEYCI